MTRVLRRCTGAAAAVAALLVSAAAAAPIDTMDTRPGQDVHVHKPRGHSEIEADSVMTVASGDVVREPAYDISDTSLPHYFSGKIEIGPDVPSEVDSVVAVGDVMGMDNRDPESSYVFATEALDDATTFVFYNLRADGKLLIRVVSNPMSGQGQRWFLGVHGDRLEDTLDGRLRVILHSDASKAAIWEWTDNPSGNGKVLQLVDNRYASDVCKGCYLAGSPTHNSMRTDNSFYLVATPEPKKASNVNLRASSSYQETHATPE